MENHKCLQVDWLVETRSKSINLRKDSESFSIVSMRKRLTMSRKFKILVTLQVRCFLEEQIEEKMNRSTEELGSKRLSRETHLCKFD